MPDSPAITLWRNQYRLNLNLSWRAEVDKTVTDVPLWRQILAKWKREKRHPGIKDLLAEYESRSADAEHQRRSFSTAANQRQVCSNGSSESMERERVHWQMPPLLDRKVR